ncbi:D-alanyl-D-alanine carboxypeptidase [Desulfoprunum benzoelyticum]|uniref:D-alanyl-D-alanine carboxypeptidase (Penicillin-binding protein 5/6) n=1 Tax=Desulfoprunum benzoelyticum TaxID=1506996 RepID=A0A840UWP7_9BACT|nr:serine hydrolase [Desulfoprunum benzoelyticum]MBB5347118.1 D-alanyl-D-alanine carboxypeptidase (penicillin-binding protein 5/6) [Desulfoprunum benzoelyticum]MBM9531247.1 D-alanyl-D-alanine carboxypeptidase [Desulfoprunum benzoelyticum]
MNRLTILGTTLLTLLFFTVITLFSLTSHADAATKKKYVKKRTAGTSTVVVLGKYNDISKVKQVLRSTECPAPAKVQAVSSPRKKSTTSPVDNSRIGKLISARSAIIIDGRSGRTLYAKNADNPRQPASTIKILTGMIALKSLSGSEQVSVSRRAADQPRSKVDLNPKKHYQANDLINAVLLASANDASVALAEKIAGSESSFARMMTEKAREWGAKNTVCKTASGLTAKGQTSTARDLAVMFRHFMQDPAFASRMKQVKVKTSYGSLLRNHNKALWQVEGTQGGKTGFTNAARQTYVGKFKRGNQEIVIAVMGCETMWADVKKLVQHGFSLQERLVAAPSSSTIAGHELVARSTP